MKTAIIIISLLAAVSDVSAQTPLDRYRFDSVRRVVRHTAGSGTSYIILAEAGAGGIISPGGAVVVDSSANKSFAISANSLYRWDSLLVDDVSVTVSSPYTFTNVTATHTIRAVFSLTSGGIYIVSSGGDSLKSSGGDYLILP